MECKTINDKFICAALAVCGALCVMAVEFPDPAQFNPT